MALPEGWSSITNFSEPSQGGDLLVKCLGSSKLKFELNGLLPNFWLDFEVMDELINFGRKPTILPINRHLPKG